MDRDNSCLFKIIIESVVLRRKVFQNVLEIHDQMIKNDVITRYNKYCRYNWYELGCFPDMLVKFNYIERYKCIFNTLLLDKSIDKSVVDMFKKLYLDSLTVAATLGNIQVFKFFNDLMPIGDKRKWIFSKNCWDCSFATNNDVLIDLAPISSLEVLKLVHDNRSGEWANAIDSAAKVGKLENIKYLREKRTEGFTHSSFREASNYGHLGVFKFLLNKSNDMETMHLQTLLQSVNIDKVQYLIDNPQLLDVCCNNGYLSLDRAAWESLEMVKFIHERFENIYCSENAMITAARENRLDIVKFLHDNRTEGCTENAMDLAAGRGHLEVVKFLHHNRTEGWTSYGLTNAAVNGHVEVVKFLVESSNVNQDDSMRLFYDFHSITVPEVCANGNFEMFKYLYETYTNNFHLALADINNFAQDISQIQWCLENTTYKLDSSVYISALKCGSGLKVIKWIHENTALQFPKNCLDSACNRSFIDLEIVQYLHEHGATATTNAIDQAASFHGNLPVLSFLHHNRTEGCTSSAMHEAIACSIPSHIQFISQNYTFTDSISTSSKAYQFLQRLQHIKQHNL